MSTGAIAVEKSANHKLGAGRCSATYVGQASCPDDCPFLGAGCYAEHGPVGIHTARVNRGSKDAAVLARLEDGAISTLSGSRPLRLHVVGDCRTEGAAKVVAAASRAYTRRGGQPVWTYTHAWRRVRKASWQGVSVLASVQTLTEAVHAWARGYAPAIVMGKLPKDGKAFKNAWTGDFTMIPCPAQTRGKTCVECKLCFNADALHERRAVIAFEAHGARANVVREVVNG